jgi:hypothetical protein
MIKIEIIETMSYYEADGHQRDVNKKLHDLQFKNKAEIISIDVQKILNKTEKDTGYRDVNAYIYSHQTVITYKTKSC